MERMYFARWRRLLLMLGVLVVVLFCTTSLVSSENPVTFADKTYRTLGDFQKSEVFRELGSRCGTPPPSRYEFISAFRALSDCNESQSANLSEYPPTTVYTIPVWVHIIMDDSCSDGAISDELVASQIEILNEDFRALAGTLGENGTDVMVQFCLAGVDRTCDDDYFNECYYNNCNFLDGQNQNETYKNDLNVDPVHNLNIYTKRWPDKSGLLGYATWPWEDAGQPRDGVAINWQNFGRDSSSGPPYDQGRTTTHEIGHYLGLLHTFQSWCTAGNVGSPCSADWHCDTSSGAGDGVCEQCGDDTDPGCYSKPGGDFICDTNSEEDPNFGCNVSAATCSSPDPIHNYMDYTDDTCMEEFTSEQAQRIVCTILNYRADLPGQCGESPTADANGPYSAECQGATAQVPLDGSGSSDPDGDPLTYAWSTDCPGGSFDDATSVTPVLTLDTSPGCPVKCNVSLTVDDGAGGTDTATSSVTISDSQTPVLTCPASVTIECDDSSDPSNTGEATVIDVCDPSPNVTYSDEVTPGTCLDEETITRTWTATDGCGNESSCVQTIEVVDTTAPVTSCNVGDATITPPDAPISFMATATDNCDGAPPVEITGYDCYLVTIKDKRIDKTESCVVEVSGDTITILDSGGVGDHITWIVSATDNCGNVTEEMCEVEVVNPGKGP